MSPPSRCLSGGRAGGGGRRPLRPDCRRFSPSGPERSLPPWGGPALLLIHRVSVPEFSIRGVSCGSQSGPQGLWASTVQALLPYLTFLILSYPMHIFILVFCPPLPSQELLEVRCEVWVPLTGEAGEVREARGGAGAGVGRDWLLAGTEPAGPAAVCRGRAFSRPCVRVAATAAATGPEAESSRGRGATRWDAGGSHSQEGARSDGATRVSPFAASEGPSACLRCGRRGGCNAATCGQKCTFAHIRAHSRPSTGLPPRPAHGAGRASVMSWFGFGFSF